ncbi:MAG: MBOAT family protein [Bacteroidales bacterium]|jgi:D-alanyl-lipoteichoic acid acyltransferase DltB (MBOAT superfamily)|nr:MBOAT family protein [Bacteroidales bacterium]
MLFNSIPFLIFFPVVTLFFYAIPHRIRWLWLLAASCFFYMFFVPQYILILLITILIDYVAGIYIEKTTGKKRKALLVMSIISTCLVLLIFKYLGFLNQNLSLLSQYLGFNYPNRTLNIILPIGLSFHTFQSLSYVIEVYRGNQKAERHFGIYSLYVMFYPQLVTGPIERPQNLLRQLREQQYFKLDNLIKGLRLILFGLFAKMVIADNLGVYVDNVYADPGSHNSWSILTALFFYSFQIYCDFFGYSTVAVGCAKAMGYSITDNFRTPYLAQNIGEFWHRWHISLSTWFRDYVYFPLGGSRVKTMRLIFNVMVVFMLSGFWHGANWTFVCWGAAYGIVYLIERPFHKFLSTVEKCSTLLRIALRSLSVIKNFILITAIWVLFRAPDLSHIKTIFTSIAANFTLTDHFSVKTNVWLFLGLFILLDILLRKSRFDNWCSRRHPIVRWCIYVVMFFAIIVFASVNSFPFIYFQF